MAELFNDGFETDPGTDETWATAAQESGAGAWNPDYAVSNIGSPSGWGTYCLRVYSEATNDGAYRDHYWGSGEEPTSYSHVAVYLQDLSNMGSNTNMLIQRIYANSYSPLLEVLLRYDGLNYFFRCTKYLDSSVSYDSENVTQGSWYRIQYKHDNPNNAAELRIHKSDDTEIESQSWAFTTDKGQRTIRVGKASAYQYGAICYDNIIFDNADWVYTPSGGGSAVPIIMQQGKKQQARRRASSLFWIQMPGWIQRQSGLLVRA